MKALKKAIPFVCVGAILASLSIGGFFMVKTPVSYLSIDINPSVELGVNSFNQVISVKGFNEDGELLLDGKKIVNCNVSDAVKILIKSASDSGFIAQDGSTVVSVTSETDSKTISDKLINSSLEGAANAVKENGDSIILRKDSVPLALRKKAEELGVTAGKLNLINKLQDVDPTATIEEYKNAKVTDIINKTKEIKKEENIADNDSELITVDSTTDVSKLIVSYGDSSNEEKTGKSDSDITRDTNQNGAIVTSTEPSHKKESQPVGSSTVNSSDTTSTNDQIPPESLPITLYNGGTEVTFLHAKWGCVSASIVQRGADGTNCIQYDNLLSNPYSPGPSVVLPRPKNIQNVQPTDKLQLKIDIGTVTYSQPVKIIFNDDPDISITTPNLNRTAGYQIVTLDISNVLDKLNGRIYKLSFEGAGPNGWQGVSYLLVDDIQIVTPVTSEQGNTIEPVPPVNSEQQNLPICIYKKGDVVTFCPAPWGSIKADVINKNDDGQKLIQFSNIHNNVYAQTPDIVFSKPINISGLSSKERLKISLNLGETKYPQALKVMINGSDNTCVVTPLIRSSSEMQDVYVDISAIGNKLGGQISQIALESAAPNGFTNVDNLYIGEISIAAAPTDSISQYNEK